MADSHYTLAQEHSKEHLEFTLTIQGFIRNYDKKTEGLCDEMLTFLRLWWLSHVAAADQKFGEYLKEEGYVP